MISDAGEFKTKMQFLELIPIYKRNGIQQYRIGCGVSTYEAEFPISDSLELRLGEENKRQQKKFEFQSKYPFLHPYINSGSLQISSLWVERNGRDAESMPLPEDHVTWTYTEEEFKRHNEEARKANQKGWFYCSNCGMAKPESEYAYSHFAGKYCTKCKEEDPDSYKAAMNENYE